MTNALQPLPAARQVDSLLDAARTLLLNAEEVAIDGRLVTIAQRIRERIESLGGELLREVAAKVQMLERRQSKEVEALETARRAAASGVTPVITRSLRDLEVLDYFPARPRGGHGC